MLNNNFLKNTSYVVFGINLVFIPKITSVCAIKDSAKIDSNEENNKIVVAANEEEKKIKDVKALRKKLRKRKAFSKISSLIIFIIYFIVDLFKTLYIAIRAMKYAKKKKKDQSKFRKFKKALKIAGWISSAQSLKKDKGKNSKEYKEMLDEFYNNITKYKFLDDSYLEDLFIKFGIEYREFNSASSNTTKKIF